MSKNANLVEVAFKRERRGIYRNRHDLDIKKGDLVLVEADRGQDLGRVSLVGSLVPLKRGKGETRGIIRRADASDREIQQKNLAREQDALSACRKGVIDHNLEMKLVDVELQFDGSKITFYFTSSQRVDFRELVKDLASQYRTRIELRQIGVRDEARRITGCGVCGRPQCCCTFLTDFEQVTTQMARDQQLALNPTKISGNCGRLLCCLRYEDEYYCGVMKQFPPVGSRVSAKGRAGLLTSINVFEPRGLVVFEDKTQEWFTPQELEKGPAAHDGPKPQG